MGQAIFGGPWEELDTPGYVTAGLGIIGYRIGELRGTESLIVANDGEPPYSNDVFTIRTYCWCDGNEHPEGCPPNFDHPASGLQARWYKHAQRGASINREVDSTEWSKILSECLA